MVGAILGAPLEHVRADRILSGVLALVSFSVFQRVTRSGHSGLHRFLLFPAGAPCAIQGPRRQQME